MVSGSALGRNQTHMFPYNTQKYQWFSLENIRLSRYIYIYGRSRCAESKKTLLCKCGSHKSGQPQASLPSHDTTQIDSRHIQISSTNVNKSHKHMYMNKSAAFPITSKIVSFLFLTWIIISFSSSGMRYVPLWTELQSALGLYGWGVYWGFLCGQLDPT